MEPAGNKELTIASILYFQKYNQELPMQDYSKQDIDYIIQQLAHSLESKGDIFASDIIH